MERRLQILSLENLRYLLWLLFDWVPRGSSASGMWLLQDVHVDAEIGWDAEGTEQERAGDLKMKIKSRSIISRLA